MRLQSALSDLYKRLMNAAFPSAKYLRIPDSSIIELTNCCNLRCPVCPTHFAMNRPRGFLDESLYVELLDELQSLKRPPVKLLFNMCGEPLLHAQAADFFRQASERGFKTLLSTNCTPLNPELSQQIVDSGLTEILLCLDGFTKESYEAYRVGADFDQVKSNIEMFLKIKREKQSSTPNTIIQCLLTSFSESQEDDIQCWAEEHGADRTCFKTLSMGTYTSEEQKLKYAYLLPACTEKQRAPNTTAQTCAIPMRQVMVLWNGDLALCCKDFDNAHDMPNIKPNGFLKTFRSQKVVALRRAGCRRELSLCQRCTIAEKK